MGEFCSDKGNRNNAVAFTIMYVACSFNYYMINFYMKYLPGSIYVNNICNSWADALGGLSAMFVLRYMTIKRGFIFAFFLATVSMVIVMLCEQASLNVKIADVVGYGVPFGVLGAKFGTSMAFTFLYSGMIQFFRSDSLGLMIDLSNVIGRTSSVAAPMIAE